MQTREDALEEAAEELITAVASRWSVFLLRGFLLLLFGILLIAYPDATIYTITRIFGAFLLVDAFFCFCAIVMLCKSGATWRMWSPYLLAFLASAIIGGGSLAYPGMTIDSLFKLTGAWFLVVGVAEFAVACVLRKVLTGACSGCMMIGALLDVLLAIALLSNPAAAVSTLAIITGVIIILFGLEVTFLGIELRSIKNNDGSTNLSSNQTSSMV